MSAFSVGVWELCMGSRKFREVLSWMRGHKPDSGASDVQDLERKRWYFLKTLWDLPNFAEKMRR